MSITELFIVFICGLFGPIVVNMVLIKTVFKPKVPTAEQLFELIKSSENWSIDQDVSYQTNDDAFVVILYDFSRNIRITYGRDYFDKENIEEYVQITFRRNKFIRTAFRFKNRKLYDIEPDDLFRTEEGEIENYVKVLSVEILDLVREKNLQARRNLIGTRIIIT